jgi:hypothetical protein
MKKEEDSTDGLELRISKKSWRNHLTEELWSKEKGCPQNFTDLEFRSVYKDRNLLNRYRDRKRDRNIQKERHRHSEREPETF